MGLRAGGDGIPEPRGRIGIVQVEKWGFGVTSLWIPVPDGATGKMERGMKGQDTEWALQRTGISGILGRNYSL